MAVITFDDGTKATVHSNDVDARRRAQHGHRVPHQRRGPGQHHPEHRASGSTRPTPPCGATSTSPRRSRRRPAGSSRAPRRTGCAAIRRSWRTSWTPSGSGARRSSGATLARDVVEVIYAGYLSAATGRRVELARRMIPFVKGHGLGNDYLVMKEADLPGPLGGRHREDLRPELGRRLRRHPPARAHGPRADFGLRIFNPDGSEAEKSGNGLRIFAKYLWDHGHATRRRLHGRHPGRHRGVPVPGRGRARHLRDRGDGPRDVPAGRDSRWTEPDREVVAVPLALGDGADAHGDGGVGRQPALRGLRRPPGRRRVPAPRPAARAPSGVPQRAPTSSSRACSDATRSRS